MRKLPFITIGKILDELAKEQLDLKPITFKRREKDIPGFPQVQKNPNDWRRYTRAQAELIKRLLRKYYQREENVPLTSSV